MDASIPGSLLCDELRIYCDAMEEFFIVGLHHAWPFYYPDNYKLEESP
jgi:hypothetical protein